MTYRCPECGTWWPPDTGPSRLQVHRPWTARTCANCACAIYDVDDAQAAARQDVYEEENR